MLKKSLLMICWSLSMQAASLQCEKPITFTDPRFNDVDDPVIASNEKGDIAIAWVASHNETQTNLQVAFKTEGQSWSNVETVPSGNESPEKIRLAVNEAGKTTLFWRESDANRTYYYYGQKSPEEFWTAPFRSVDRSSKLHAQLCTDTVIFVGTPHQLGEAVQTERPVPYQLSRAAVSLHNYPDFYQESSCHLNSHGDGLAFAFQRNWENKAYSLKCFWLQDNAWSAPQSVGTIPDSGYLSKHTCLKSENSSERSGVIFLTLQDKNWKQWLRAITINNGQWSQDEDLVLDFDHIYDYKLKMNSQDGVLIVWANRNDDAIESAFKPKGQPWIRSSLDLPNKTMLDLEKVISDSEGNFVVIWTAPFTAIRHLQGVRREGVYGAVFSVKDQTWSDPVLLSPHAFKCLEPSITLTKPGHGFITWVASNGTDEGIQVAELTYTP
jgi:hypothetical protein